MSRYRVLSLLIALVALASLLAACGGSSDSSGEDPQKVLDTATLQGVESGNLDLSLSVKATGDEAGNLDLSLSGPFQSEGGDELPRLGLEASASGSFGDEDVDFKGGLTLLPEEAFIEYEGTNYEVDSTTLGFVKSAIEQAQSRGDSESGSTSACQEAAANDIKIGDFVDNLNNEGSADVDGTSTTKVSGDLRAPGAIEALVKLIEDPACKAQFEAAGPLPLGELEAAKTAIGKALKKSHVEVYVGDDDIIRRVAAELLVEAGEGKEKGTVAIDFELSLAGVNESQTITAPKGAKSLSLLFQKLNVNPIELAELGSSGGGLGALLEGITGGDDQGSPGKQGGGSKEYLDCLKGARTPADLQKCANLLK